MSHFLELLLSPLGFVFSSSSVLIILIMMLYMSWKLYINRRRKAYLYLTVSMFVVHIHYLMLIGMGEEGRSSVDMYHLTGQVLKIVSFVLINYAFYQLYNSTKRRHTLYFWGLMFITACLAIVHYRVPYIFEGTAKQVQLLQEIGLELFLFLLVLLAFYYIAPRLLPQVKYRIALSLYFIEQLSSILNRFIYDNSIAALTVAERLMPIFFYLLLFQMLFERIVELLQAIYKSSITDGLTGLYNRKFFLKRIQQYVRHGHKVSVIFGDIDNFKRLNDTEGHQRGDEVLKQVAGIAIEIAEEQGIAGRYGGEEIVLLITDPDTDALELAEYFRERVEQESGATISLGCCTWKEGWSPEELVRYADEAMYQAKTTGKNKVVAYSVPRRGKKSTP
jgi:two-component system, cell cycle response regulator